MATESNEEEHPAPNRISRLKPALPAIDEESHKLTRSYPSQVVGASGAMDMEEKKQHSTISSLSTVLQ
jgi:hypothetical protein